MVRCSGLFFLWSVTSFKGSVFFSPLAISSVSIHTISITRAFPPNSPACHAISRLTLTSSDTFLLGHKAGKEEATVVCSRSGFFYLFIYFNFIFCLLSSAHFRFREAVLCVTQELWHFNHSVLLRKEQRQSSVPSEGWALCDGWQGSAAPYDCLQCQKAPSVAQG